MKIEVKIDASCEEPKILLITNKMTDEVSGVLKKLSGEDDASPDFFEDKAKNGRIRPAHTFQHVRWHL